MLMTGSVNRRPASAYVRDVLAQTKAKNPSEPEFHQAVEEVLESRAAFYVKAREIEQRNKLAPGTLTAPPAAAGSKAPPQPAKEDDEDEPEEGKKP